MRMCFRKEIVLFVYIMHVIPRRLSYENPCSTIPYLPKIKNLSRDLSKHVDNEASEGIIRYTFQILKIVSYSKLSKLENTKWRIETDEGRDTAQIASREWLCESVQMLRRWFYKWKKLGHVEFSNDSDLRQDCPDNARGTISEQGC